MNTNAGNHRTINSTIRQFNKAKENWESKFKRCRDERNNCGWKEGRYSCKKPGGCYKYY